MLIQVTDKLRVEDGPARKRAMATPELMEKLKAHYTMGGIDALGKRIIKDQHFDYLDWDGSRVWYAYKMDVAGIYQPVGVSPIQAEAMKLAKAAK